MLAFAFSGLMVLSAGAQQPLPGRSSPAPNSPSHPADPPPPAQPSQQHQSRVDQLFERLAASRNEAEAGALADQIARIWTRSGSDTLDLLFARVGEAMQKRQYEVALDLIDSILALKTDWAEPYARRAAILFQRQDMDGAMRDLRLALALEPRHFQALAGVAMIFHQNGQKKQALAAFRAALSLNPHFKGIKEAAERLAQDGGDQDI